jgi:cell division protein FtsB
MQAPLRKGKKEETLGRARGVKRTGRSLLFGLVLLAVAAASSLTYTWERLIVESMLIENQMLEAQLDLIRNRSETLSFEVAELRSLARIRERAERELGMSVVCWDDILVIRDYGEVSGEAR